MAAPRKPKKKKANIRVLIAIGIAAFIGLALLVLIMGQKGSQSAMQGEISKMKEEVEAAKKKAQELEQIKMLEEQNQKASNAAANAPVKETTTIVVAKRSIDAGTRLSAELLDTQELPQEAVPVNSFNYTQAVIGRIASSDIASGEPILPNKLIDKDTQTLAIPDGFRAMTIPVTNITGVGGFINPGCRVDILSVMAKSMKGASKEAKGDDKISKILIQNVKVLATSGKSAAAADSKGGASSGQTITIAVPADQVIKLALAFNNGEGQIQVVMRGYNDAAEITKTEMDTGELITGNSGKPKNAPIPQISLPKPPSETSYAAGNNTDLNSILNNPEALPPPEPPTAQTKTHSVELIQANSRSEVSFETEM